MHVNLNARIMKQVTNKVKRVRECNPDQEENSICITFDVDWASDEVILDTLNILSNYDIPTTWFFTHQSDTIDNIRSYNGSEIGIHPNFNNILNKTDNNESVDSILMAMMRVVPDATSLRSHSLTYGDIVARAALKNGIKRVSNYLIPFHSNIVLNPWADWYGLIHVPYLFQDSVLFYLNNSKNIVDLVRSYPGLKVFNFHPIHIFLNTESIDRYENCRTLHHKPDALLEYRYNGYGTRSIFIELLNTIMENL